MLSIRNKTVALLLLGALSMAGAACAGSDDGGGGEGGGAGSADARGGEAPVPEPADGGGGAADMAYEEESLAQSSGGGSATNLPGLGPSVIKTADISVEVEHDGFQDAMRRAVQIAEQRGGFVVSSGTRGADARRGSLVVRVPSEDFETTLAALGDLGKVKRQTVTGEDVSQEFIDLDARLRNLEAQEAVLLRLMDRAESISAIIRVQRELSGVQLEIERLTGRQNYLEDRTQLGTISVGLVEAGSGPKDDPGALAHAWDVARDTMTGMLSGLLVGAAAVVPVALVVGILAALGWTVFRRVRPQIGPAE